MGIRSSRGFASDKGNVFTWETESVKFLMGIRSSCGFASDKGNVFTWETESVKLPYV